MNDLEEEQRSKLLSRIAALELEFNTRCASRDADTREVDEIAGEEVLDELEKTLRDPAAQWDSDSDADDGQRDDHTATTAADTSAILRHARHTINSLSSMTILVRNDNDKGGNDENNTVGRNRDERPRDVLVETVQGMTFRTVLELVCEYWGLHLDSNFRLVDERGTWHKVDSAVHSSIRPSRRHYPMLYLQKRKGIEDVLRRCEFGAAMADNSDFGLDKKPELLVAPLLTSSNPLLTLQEHDDDDEKKPEAVVGPTAGGILSITNASKSIWKKDPILFTWRRVALDFFLALFLFIVLCVFLALTPKYTEAQGVSLMMTDSLVNVNFYSPPLALNDTKDSTLKRSPKQVLNWEDFWAWMDGPFTEVVTNPAHFAERQCTIFGPVRLRQTRVKPVPCARQLLRSSGEPCYPQFTTRDELTDPTFAGTQFVTESVASLGGVFGNYPAQGYVVDVHPRAPSQSQSCGPLLNVCGGGASIETNDTSCWRCIMSGLQNNATWLDEGTRLVTVQFLVYSANANMFIDSKFAFELATTGYIYMSYEIRYLTAHQSANKLAFLVIVSLLLVVIAVQFLQCIAFVRAVWQEAHRAAGVTLPASFPYFIWRIVWSLPTRFTIWNPIIFVLCVVGLTYVNRQVPFPVFRSQDSPLQVPFTTIQSISDLQNGEIILGVANMAAAYKLSTYFEFTSRFLTYFNLLGENLFMLCVAMTVTLSSFAWLLTVTTGTSSLGVSATFEESFVFVVRLLLNQVTPDEFYELGADMWLSLSWIFYASQIVLNLLLVRIAAPICYHALIREESAADYVLESLRRSKRSIRQWLAT